MASQFASKLGTNYCPLDEEVLEIESLLVQPLSRLQDLDDRIADLQKVVDELTEERTNVKIYVDAHRALLSPVRRLSLDVLQEIFVACLPTHRNCVMSASEAPVLLGRICSSWRNISLSTPRLWSSLHIVEPARIEYLPKIREQKHAQLLEVTKAWLERSGQCPLTISLFGRAPPVPAPLEYSGTSVFLQTLLPFASRWLDISVTASSLGLDSLSSVTENDIPMLRTLKISEIYERPLPLGNQWGSSGLLRGPNISSFTFSRSHTNSLLLPLRWDQLLTLSITGRWVLGVTTDVAVGIFSRCPRLQTCQLLMNDEVQS
ncbi:hypothetical protein B0H12DRAFT_966372, partial [Mycena haematopus]